MLRQHTNLSGETYEEPYEMKVSFRNRGGHLTTLTIRGFDAADCRETYDRVLPKFREYESKGEYMIGTPRLGQYYRARDNYREFLDIT